VFAGLFYHQSYLVHYFLPLTVLGTLSQVKTKGQYHNSLHKAVGTMSLSLSKISVSQSSDILEYVYAHNSQKILTSFTTLLRKDMISTERIYERKQKGYLNLWLLAAVYGSNSVGSGRDCASVIWDPIILLQAVNNSEAISEKDQLKNAL